jgi:hypothetical protein
MSKANDAIIALQKASQDGGSNYAAAKAHYLNRKRRKRKRNAEHFAEIERIRQSGETKDSEPVKAKAKPRKKKKVEE